MLNAYSILSFLSFQLQQISTVKARTSVEIKGIKFYFELFSK